MIDNKLKKYVLKRAKEERKTLPSNYLNILEKFEGKKIFNEITLEFTHRHHRSKFLNTDALSRNAVSLI